MTLTAEPEPLGAAIGIFARSVEAIEIIAGKLIQPSAHV